MGRRDDLIGRAAQTIQDQCGLTPDIELLAAVVDGCGPAIYSAAQSAIGPDDSAALATVRHNFLSAKLALPDKPELDDAIQAAIDTFGPAPGEGIPRPVLYYLLLVQCGRQDYYI